MSARPTTPTAPASVLPGVEMRSPFMVEANPVIGAFILMFVAGPQGQANSNIKAEVFLTPADAERLACEILDDLEDFPERVAKLQAAMAGAR